MKKILLPLTIAAFGWMTMQAQTAGTIFITGSGADYVYVDNTYIYTNDAARISFPTSFLYLRRDGQLLQSGNVPNTGRGFLSVYQEGTVNNFQYNYWCSPVGVYTAPGTGNIPFGLAGLYGASDVTSSTVAAMAAGYDGTASPFAISNSWIYKYQLGNDYLGWGYVGSGTTLNTGEGFTMKGTSGTDATNILGVVNNSGSKQRYDFRGRPNNGNITINVGDGRRTLTGNPYPSAIDLSAFLTAATNTTGIAYFWEHDKTADSHYLASYRGGYGTFSPVSRGGTGIYVSAPYSTYDGAGNSTGVYSNPNFVYERRFSPIGQGFLIEGNANGTTATMLNDYRVYVREGAANLSEFERGMDDSNGDFLPEIASVSGFDYTTVSTAGVPQIKFNVLLENQGLRQMVLAFDPEATDGADHAMDALMPGDNTPADAYFVIEDKGYVIDVIDFDLDKKIPVGFKNSVEANFKITVNEFINFSGAQNVYLHDKVSDMYFDIKNNFYEMVLPAGTNNTQYEITFKSEKPVIENVSKNLAVNLSSATNNLVVSNPEKVALATCSLYDVAGKLIFTKKDLGMNEIYEFPVSGLGDGVYIVRLITNGNTEISKKIIIKK